MNCCFCSPEEMICGNDDEDDEVDGEDSESDNEDDTDDEETNENNNKYPGFLEHVFESLLDKLKLLKTRVGRAGLVHNFLRGLEVLSAPVASGVSPFFWISCFFLACVLHSYNLNCFVLIKPAHAIYKPRTQGLLRFQDSG